MDAFPLHNEPLSTDWGRGDHIMVDLVVEDGCLRTQGPSPSYLLIWPDGFTQSDDRISDRSGAFVARVGDKARFSGRPIRPNSDHAHEIANSVPEKCTGPYYLVGDDVTAIGPDEPEVVSVPGSSLYFPRRKTQKTTSWVVEDTLELASEPLGLILDKDCLIVNHGKKGVLQWPAGFYPHIGEDGVIEVRNGGGRTVARVGDRLRMRGNVTSEGVYVPECEAWLGYVSSVRNIDLPVVFPQHQGEWNAFANRIEGYLEVHNGCMYIRGHILIWPSDFMMEETEDHIQILNENNRIVGRIGHQPEFKYRATFKGSRVNQDDNHGRQIRLTLPLDCPHGPFWIVTD